MEIRSPRGTVDLLPDQARLWDIFARTASEVFSGYGYEPIQTPLFEQTDLFVRGIGETTDVVSKEMFTVMGPSTVQALIQGEDPDAEHRLTLRPEGTASVARAVVQHNLVPQGGAPLKVFYAGPMFRYERPQKGRQREFLQIGAEMIGAAAPSADAEMIIMLIRFYEAIGVPRDSMRILVNSMGDAQCRADYRAKLDRFLAEEGHGLCLRCQGLIETNPLRVFDCKNPQCIGVMKDAPTLSENLCEACAEHHEQVLRLISHAGIDYIEDPSLVRGLDYYTRTVFEVQVDAGLGSQNAIGGGGRYDRLVEIVGGDPTPGLGFSIGFERTALALAEAGTTPEPADEFVVYVAAAEDPTRSVAFQIAQRLRDVDVRTELDHQGRSLKSQFKQADRLGARLTVVVGTDELSHGEVLIRDMESREEETVALDGVEAHVESIVSAWEIDAYFESYDDEDEGDDD